MSDTDANLAVSQAQLSADRFAFGATNHNLSALEFGQNAGTIYKDQAWERQEGVLRREWEEKYTDSAWEDVKQWVREGWDNVRKTVSGEND